MSDSSTTPTPRHMLPGRSPVDRVGEWFTTIVDHGSRLQAPAVAAYVRALRQAHPDETPAQIIERLEKRYTLAVTGSGAGVGATAAVPGIGTLGTVAALGAESAFFVEASALLALSIAEVHGISPRDQELRKTLVLSAILGDEGLVTLAAALGTRVGPLRRFGLGSMASSRVVGVNRALLKLLTRKTLVRKAPLALGKMLPAGIGAVIGGAGNRALGQSVVGNTRDAFGPPPRTWPVIDGHLADPVDPADPVNPAGAVNPADAGHGGAHQESDNR